MRHYTLRPTEQNVCHDNYINASYVFVIFYNYQYLYFTEMVHKFVHCWWNHFCVNVTKMNSGQIEWRVRRLFTQN